MEGKMELWYKNRFLHPIIYVSRDRSVFTTLHNIANEYFR